jgi:hypothetical protein
MYVAHDEKALSVNGVVMEMPSPVRERVNIGELAVVRTYPENEKLSAYPRAQLNRNVYAFDGSGKLVWQIQEAPHGGANDKPYMRIEAVNGQLIAGNWIGVDYRVNLADGMVEAVGSDRRPW